MTVATRDRLRLTYDELVELALKDRPPEELRALLVELIHAYCPDGDPERPRPGAGFTAAVGALIAPFHPDTLGYVPGVLVKALGDELVLWLEEGLRRPPTTTDVAKLYARLPTIGIREAIHQTCQTWNLAQPDEPPDHEGA
jgi:hypothetical protein